MATHAACARKMKADDARRRQREINTNLGIREGVDVFRPPKPKRKRRK